MSLGHRGDELTWNLPNGTFYYAGGPDVNCTLAVCPVEITVYGYRPSLAASIALIVLYVICAVVQFGLAWRYKTWGFFAVMFLGCIDEILGYVGRIMMYYNPWNHNGFIMQIAIYVMLYQMCVGLLSNWIILLTDTSIIYISPEKSRFKPKIFYYTFISCDIISLILQAVGGGMSASSNGPNQTGVDISLAGLSFQIITLFFFCVLTVDYMIRSRSVWKAVKLPRKFLVFSSFLTLALLFIFIRCCYRVYELHQGYSRDSTALRDEPLFIGLESVMVIVAAYCLIVAHPGPIFNHNEGPAYQLAHKSYAEPKTGSTSVTTASPEDSA